MEYVLFVPDMSCNHCKMRISKLLEKEGVKDYEIDLTSKTVTLKADDINKICEELAKIGYPVKACKPR
ncbi:heavy-metal-associated domain-containing protein [Pseudothermotoga thermarum]|uniref:Heavy metal transport/detoxification protein n=1 Tax=Pseudothermotoga thermarum DSM 5069 TaxID=688269 RepID=F7YWG5_9THEM|nr:heavy-metal-associated domain-containing protein [Pseudothermotoga thermarum]AEH51944.1 Heavy metal transport/detoxification protein [Pseudothermotoga thermarum DSM 5069]